MSYAKSEREEKEVEEAEERGDRDAEEVNDGGVKLGGGRGHEGGRGGTKTRKVGKTTEESKS